MIKFKKWNKKWLKSRNNQLVKNLMQINKKLTKLITRFYKFQKPIKLKYLKLK